MIRKVFLYFLNVSEMSEMPAFSMHYGDASPFSKRRPSWKKAFWEVEA